MLNFRLYSFMQNPSKALGCMPDIYRIMGKCGLTGLLLEYLSNSSFPNRTSWKKIVSQSLTQCMDTYLYSTIESNHALHRFKFIHSDFVPCNLWHFSKLYRSQLQYCFTAMHVLSMFFSKKYHMSCPDCKHADSYVYCYTLITLLL